VSLIVKGCEWDGICDQPIYVAVESVYLYRRRTSMEINRAQVPQVREIKRVRRQLLDTWTATLLRWIAHSTVLAFSLIETERLAWPKNKE
jgi:sterol desaturase/sphingolipid hydroxylase (fatty acid hydroxylase superfamily)